MTQKIMYLDDLAKYIGKLDRTAQRWVEKWLNGDYKKKCDRLLKNGTV